MKNNLTLFFSNSTIDPIIDRADGIKSVYRGKVKWIVEGKNNNIPKRRYRFNSKGYKLSLSMNNGKSTTWDYAKDNKTLKHIVSSINGQVVGEIRFTYDGENRLIHTVDHKRVETDITYSADGKSILYVCSDCKFIRINHEDETISIICSHPGVNDEIFKLNKNFRIIYYKSSSGLEMCFDYDNSESDYEHHVSEIGHGRWIDSTAHLREYCDSRGNHEWYNKHGDVIHYKFADGDEEWYDYDEQRRVINYKDSYGTKCKYTYNDETGEHTEHSTDPSGYEEIFTFDKDNNVIHFENSTGYVINYRSNKI